MSRAGSVWALAGALGAEPALAPGEGIAVGLPAGALHADEAARIAAATSDDLALAAALIDAERERRAAQWAALEALLALAPGTGTLADRASALPDPEFVRACVAADRLGWLAPVPWRC